jgi:heparinase II/III-like protein
VIEDRLEAATEHDYDLRFHLAPSAATVEGRTVRAPGLTLTLEGAETVQLEPGWISPRYGERIAAPVVSARRRGRDVSFVTLVRPG